MNALKFIQKTGFIALLICLTVHNTSHGQETARGASGKNHPEAGLIHLKGSPDSRENTSLRDAYSRTFVHPDGSFSKQQGLLPLHYEKDGYWRTIIDQIAPHTAVPALYTLEQTALPISIDAHSGKTSMQLTSTGASMEFGAATVLQYVNAAGNVIQGQSMQTGTSVVQTANTLLLQNAWEGVDRRQDVHFWAVETDYLLHSRPALAVAGGKMIFTESVTLPQGWRVSRGEGTTTANGWEGELIITDRQGMPQATFQLLLFHDSDRSTISGSYQYHQRGNQLQLSVIVPADWLLDAARVYPVTIDPTATNSFSGFTSIAGPSAYSGACVQTVNVAVPAGVISGTSADYTIQTVNGAARMSDQVSRVGTGGVWSANQFGAGGTTGTYTYDLNGLTIANGTHPGGNIAFDFQGYRTAGGTGCNTTYQRRNGNLIFTVDYKVKYATQWISMNTGSASWCAGETRTVSVTVKNVGTAAWIDGPDDFNIGVKWNAEADYLIRVDAQNLAPDGTRTYNLTVTAPAAGTNNLTFDAVHEADCWFGWNSLNCGPGNVTYTTGTQTIKANPTVNAGTDFNFCNSSALSGTSSAGSTLQWTGPGTFAPSGTILNPSVSMPGTYILTATANGCSASDQIVVAVPNSTAPTSISGTGTFCRGNNVVLTASGGSLGTGASYQWYTGSCGGTAAGTGNSITVSPTTTTTYYVRASAAGGCPATVCTNGTVTMPTAGTTLSINNQSATCRVTENNYIHFYHSSGRLLASVNSNGQNLGNVSVTSYIETVPLAINACEITNIFQLTSLLNRHWVITPEFQPTLPVSIRLPFDNALEYTPLAALANANNSPFDDLASIAGLKLSKYSGPANVDNIASNNCPAAGGSGGTTILSQIANGNLSTYAPGFSTNEKYLEFSINGFSEFWLHGSSGASPLPVELTDFSASCNTSGDVNLAWTTASELNSQKFGLEQSRDLENWMSVGEQPAAGSSSSDIQYTATDAQAFAGISYYRLIQTDNNGIEKIYGPISVSCSGSANSMTVYPNPAAGVFTVEINSAEQLPQANVQLIDLTGKLIANRFVNLVAGSNHVLFDEKNLQRGTYLVRLVSERDQFVPVRVVVD
jgi:hypothetical protein